MWWKMCYQSSWKAYVIFLFQVLKKFEFSRQIFEKCILTLKSLTWKIRWAPNNASRWHIGFNSAFKGLIFMRSHPMGTLLIIADRQTDMKKLIVIFFRKFVNATKTRLSYFLGMWNWIILESDFNPCAKAACFGNVRLQYFFLQKPLVYGFTLYKYSINLSVTVYVTAINLNYITLPGSFLSLFYSVQTCTKLLMNGNLESLHKMYYCESLGRYCHLSIPVSLCFLHTYV